MKTITKLLMALLFLATPLFVGAQASMTGGNAASETVSDYNPNPVVVQPLDFASIAVYNRDEVLFDNGPFVTHPGAGPGGADRSELQNTTLGMTTLGSNVSLAANYRMADDFTVPAGGWNIETFKFYGYQTNSTTTSTFNAVNLKIWDGNPLDAGSAVVWGDGVTNLFSATSWTNCYRDQENLAGNTARPIMEIVADVSGLFLPAGTYWVDYQLGGTLASGPWTSPITILGQTTTGNAMHFTTTTWIPWLMGTTNTPQGALFKITGTVPASATTVTIGTGTTNQYQVPWNHYYQYSRTQSIYLQSEIGMPGAISKIAYNAESWPLNYTYTQIQIWMGQTTLSSFATTADWVDNASLTLVYDGPINIPGPGWFEINLQTPFVYDQTSNLIVSIYDPLNTPSYAGSTYRCYYSTPGGNRYIHGYSDSQQWPATLYVSPMMPNIQLTLEALGEGFINGVITDANTGDPIIGAIVSTGSESLITLADGAYSFTVNSGTHDITVTKAGYESQVVSVTVGGGETIVQNIALVESANVPGPVLAELNTGATAVNLSWGLPQGAYEIIYDDGVAENVTAWGLGGNMNALRFTPAGYPLQIIGGAVNIYDGTYPPEGDALTAFEMAVYDATGPNGYPGNELGVIDVTPTDFGWVHFDFSGENITIDNGDFYLVMIQGGNFPNCAPIAIDQSNPVMRSYSRFATGNGPWTPAGFNDFMMRAIVIGPGGPDFLAYSTGELVESSRISEGAMFLNTPQRAIAEVGMGIFKPIAGTGEIDRNVTGYRVHRMVEGQEGNMGAWTLLGSPTGTSLVDNSWPGLADGAYRWAVEARYPGNAFSAPVFSNVLRKNWASNVTINVSLSDPNVSPAGIQVSLTNTVFPQYAYNGTTNDDGVVNFPEVWKGNYNLVVNKFGYDLYNVTFDILTNTYTRNVMLLEITYPPTALYVDPVVIHATWVAPGVSLDLLEEDFSSSSFTTNEWTFDPAQGNWRIGTTGNPAPSAEFYWSPSVTNYSNALVSKQLSGLGMPNVKLKYDIFLSNFSSATLEQMSVDVWNGSSWVVIANHTNAGGNIPWTTYTYDITQHAQGQLFKVRFRANGANSFNINWWYVDNVMVYGEVADGGDRGVLGYYVYLDDVLAGFTEETFFQYQPEYINYGQTYTAGVRAVYESGFSPMATYVFTSLFLYPPCNLEGEDAGHAVALTWDAPGTCDPFGGGGGGGGGGTVQLEEDFEGTAFPPADWAKLNPDGGTGWESINVGTTPLPGWTGGTATAAPDGGSKMAWCTYTTGGATMNDQWLITPLVTVEDGMQLSFYMRCAYAVSYDDNVQIKLSATVQNNPAAFDVTVANVQFTSTSSEDWALYTYTLSDFVSAGSEVYIGFRETIADNFNDGAAVFIDNVYVGPPDASITSEPTVQPLAAATGGRDTDILRVEKPTIQMSDNLFSSTPFPYSGGEPASEVLRNEVILNYDGVNFDAIGLTAGGTFHVAARFPAAMVGQYAGYSLQTVDVYINNAPTNAILKIWGAGAANSPGAVLHEQAFTPSALSWNTLILSSPVTLDGNDLWVGYTVTHAAGQYPAGCDAGPANPDGAWISTDGVAWSRLYELAPTLNYNWNIRASIFPGGGGGGGPVETAGFRIYRDNVMIAEVDGETFEYLDTPLIAGSYNYKVTAIYDYNDDLVESLPEGPISVDVAPGLGFIQGVVYNCVNFQPVAGVTVTAGDFSTVSQANGTYTLVLHEGVYDLHFNAPGYFPWVEEDVTVVWEQTTTLNTCMTPFQFTVDPMQVDEILGPGNQSTREVVVTNNSTESLNWSASITFFDDAGLSTGGNVQYNSPVPNTVMPDVNTEYSPTSYTMSEEPGRDLFDLLMSFPVGDVGGTYSVATDGQFIYSAMWNSANFHKYTMTGTLIGPFTIPGAGNIRDLTFDGEFFYGAPNSTTIYKMDFNTQTLAGTISAPVAVRGIAYDAANDGFWITNGWDGPLRLISRTGATLQTLTTAAASMSGLAWENVSPGGPFLWALTQPASNNILSKINMTTGAILQTFDVATTGVIAPGSISGGMMITDKLVQGKWTFLGCAQNDVMWALELADAATWLMVNPTNGTLAAGESAIVSFNFNSDGFGMGDYLTASVMFSTNPNVGSIPVAVSMEVDEGNIINDPFASSVQLYPVPADDLLNVVMPAGIRQVRMYSYTGQLVMDKLVNGDPTMQIDVKPYHAGAYILQFITSEGSVLNKKVLISR